MIETVWPYFALVLLAAGRFPTLERSYGWPLFTVLPPVVLTHLLVTARAVGGLWRGSEEIRVARQRHTAHLLPTLLFLQVMNCDLRAILKLGTRVLVVFVCTMATILMAIALAYLLFRPVLPAEGWKMLAALGTTWVGGSANLVAAKLVIGLSESSLSPMLLADALCYPVWVVALFLPAAFAPAFNRCGRIDTRRRPGLETLAVAAPTEPGNVLLWLGLALLVGPGDEYLAGLMPVSTMLAPFSSAVLFVTIVGLVAARMPLARVPGRGHRPRHCWPAWWPCSVRRAASWAWPRHCCSCAAASAYLSSTLRCCSASTCKRAGLPHWRRSAALSRRRCWRRLIRKPWCRRQCCWPCWGWSWARASAC